MSLQLIRKAVPTVFVLVLLVGCSGEAEKIELRPDGRDPPSVARTLSIGGRLDETQSDAGKSIECAAALRLTARKVGAVANATGPQGQNVATWAADIFRDRAVRIAEDGATRVSIERAIAQRMIDKDDDVRGQAQMSIACLRILQAEEEASTPQLRGS